jgi:hypothetical protein
MPDIRKARLPRLLPLPPPPKLERDHSSSCAEDISK